MRIVLALIAILLLPIAYLLQFVPGVEDSLWFTLLGEFINAYVPKP